VPHAGVMISKQLAGASGRKMLPATRGCTKTDAALSGGPSDRFERGGKDRSRARPPAQAGAWVSLDTRARGTRGLGRRIAPAICSLLAIGRRLAGGGLRGSAPAEPADLRRFAVKNGSEALDPRSKLDLPRPGASRLMKNLEIGLRDGVRV
jgi:hypothetical protein